VGTNSFRGKIKMKKDADLFNCTFSLPKEMMDRFKNNVKRLNYPSINYAIREALRNYLEEVEKEFIKKEIEQASKDELLIKDLNSSMKFF
jgi:predicted DNA-binding protein